MCLCVDRTGSQPTATAGFDSSFESAALCFSLLVVAALVSALACFYQRHLQLVSWRLDVSFEMSGSDSEEAGDALCSTKCGAVCTRQSFGCLCSVYLFPKACCAAALAVCYSAVNAERMVAFGMLWHCIQRCSIQQGRLVGLRAYAASPCSVLISFSGRGPCKGLRLVWPAACWCACVFACGVKSSAVWSGIVSGVVLLHCLCDVVAPQARAAVMAGWCKSALRRQQLQVLGWCGCVHSADVLPSLLVHACMHACLHACAGRQM